MSVSEQDKQEGLTEYKSNFNGLVRILSIETYTYKYPYYIYEGWVEQLGFSGFGRLISVGHSWTGYTLKEHG